MKTSQKIDASLVIPLFNNEKTLIPQLRQCEKIMKKICTHYEIIICDDKSTDESALLLRNNFAKNPSFKLFFNKTNQGIAKNIRGLYRKAKYPYIVLFSVDGDWEPNDIGQLLLQAKKKHADIVIGKRTYENYSFYRKIISFFYNFLPILFFQVKTADAGSIKAFRKELFHRIPIISKGVFCEAEFIIRSAKQGAVIEIVPITYKKDKQGSGHGGKFKLIITSIVDLIRLRLSL